MSRFSAYAAALLVAVAAPLQAETFLFNTDPFAGSDALTMPGRQVVGGEPSIDFDISGDLYALDPAVFGVGDEVLLANDVVGNLPTSGANIVVLRTFDNDSDPLTPFGAGNAASLIAAQLTSPGPGFFIYFNSGLNLPRFVFSTNLDDNTADLKILARMTNLVGQSGELAGFSDANFSLVPEPTCLMLAMAACAAWVCICRVRLGMR